MNNRGPRTTRGGNRRRLNNRRITVGHFARSMPMDPPPTFKAGWKDIKLGIGIGSSSITLTTQTIKDSLNALGITADSIRLYKIMVYVNPGVAANQNRPEVILTINDPIGRGSLGQREDQGQLSRAAKVAYQYSQSIRELSLPLPLSGTNIPLAVIESNIASGIIIVSMAYYL